MGVCQSGPSAEMVLKAKQLDAMIAAQERIERDKVKLLLLGAGESGKSTVFKQMKLIYGGKFSEVEKKQSLPTLHLNIMSAIKVLVTQTEVFGLLDKVQAKAEFEMVKAAAENEFITEPLGFAISKLWKDEGIQAVWNRRAEFQVIESVQFYFNKIEFIMAPNYIRVFVHLVSESY